jgi:hypothetical protein
MEKKWPVAGCPLPGRGALWVFLFLLATGHWQLATASIAYDADSYGGNYTGTSYSWSHTCTGSNLLLVVGVAWNDNVTATATYNGVSMTAGPDGRVAMDSRSDMFGEMFYLTGPDTGSHSIVVSFSGSGAGYAHGGGTSFTGVSQSSPVDAHNYAQGTTQTAQTLNIVTVANNAMIVDLLAGYTGNYVLTQTSPQVLSWKSARYNSVPGGGSYQGPVSPAGSTSDGWTSTGSLSYWCLLAISFAPAGGTAYNRSISDTLSPSESVGRIAAFGRGLGDTLNPTESVARLRTVPRAPLDSASFSESLSRLASFGRGPSDTNSASETVARVAGFGRAASDSSSSSESVARLAGFGRATGDTYTLWEMLSAIKSGGAHAFTAQIGDSLSFSESLARVAALGRASSDTHTLTESLWGRKILLRGTLQVPGQARKGAVTGSPRTGAATGPPRTGAVSATQRSGTVPKP